MKFDDIIMFSIFIVRWAPFWRFLIIDNVYIFVMLNNGRVEHLSFGIALRTWEQVQTGYT